MGRGNLWEFKTPETDRLLYFNAPGNRVIIVSGFRSGHNSTVQAQYDAAANLRDAFLQEESNSAAKS